MSADQELTTPRDTGEERPDVAAADAATDARDTPEAADTAEAHHATDAADAATDAPYAGDAADTTHAAETTTTAPTGTARSAEDTDSDTEPREPELTIQDIREDGLPGDPGAEEAIFERWSQTQILFVKDPSSAVAEADALICEIVEARRKAFDAHRASVTDRWRGQGVEPDTEDLRLVLQDYRKILSVLFPRQQV